MLTHCKNEYKLITKECEEGGTALIVAFLANYA